MSTPTVIRAGTFTASLGVNVHMAGLNTAYGNVGNVLADLQYLGIGNVRDKSLDPSLVQTSYATLATAGIRFDLITSPSTDLSLIDAFQTAHPGAVIAIEGPNEINIWPVTYNGLTGDAAGVSFMSWLTGAVQADGALAGVQVYNLTEASAVLGTAAPTGNIHVYSHLGTEPLSTLTARLNQQAVAMPGAPVVVTEAGYNTLLSSADGVDYATQATLTLNLLMDSAKAGAGATYLYELLDQQADPTNTNSEFHFGLFDINNNPKPVATAIHNLTTILADPGANAQTFATTSLTYTITGLPSTGSTLALEKSSGAHDLTIWAEPTVWNSATDTPIVAAGKTVTVDLGATYATVLIYDPLVKIDAVSTLHNVQTVQVSVTDHPLIIETAPDQTGAAPKVGFQEILQQDTGVSATDFITANGALTLSGIASAGAAITVTDGETVLGAVTATSAGTWNLNVTLGAGGHQLQAAATLAGLSAAYLAPQMVTVATSAAAPVIASVTGGSTVAGAGGSVNTAAVTIQGTAAAGNAIIVYADGAAAGAATAGANGQWNIAASPLSAGPHVFTAAATDAAGNVSAASAAFSVNVVAPAVTLTEALVHDNGTSASDLITNNGAIRTGGATSAGAAVVLRDGATFLGSTTASNTGTWSFNTNLVGDGNHQLSVTATLNGLSTTVVNPQIIVLDTTAPNAPVIANVVAADLTATSGGASLNGAFVVQGAAEANSAVTVFADGAAIGTVAADGSGQWTVNGSDKALANGAHVFTAAAMDIAGNLGATSTPYGFTLFPTGGAFTVFGAGGIGTVDASGYGASQTLDLRPGGVSSIGGVSQNIGGAFSPTIENAIGGSGNDMIFGNDADNQIAGGGGNDEIDGAGGVDTVVFSGLRSQYTVTQLAGTDLRVTDNLAGRDGIALLHNIEQLKFGDDTLVFDLTSAQDSLVYRLYQAAFARTPDTTGFRYWANVADKTQLSAIALADQFLAAPEFAQKYGNPDNQGFATALYGNVLGRSPDAAGLTYWVDQLNRGMPHDQLLVAFASSPENIQLTGSHMSNGYWTVG